MRARPRRTPAEPDLLLLGPQGPRARGRDTLAEIMNSDLDAGVRQRLNE
jgi:RNA polymerase sigma-70 factor (ECF subfamily)